MVDTCLTYLLVDDEPLARSRLKRLLKRYSHLCCAAEASHADEALTLFNQTQPDILFLDIQMPGLNGLELAKQLQLQASPPAIIFMTAYPEHALQAYDVAPVDYLLKPVTEERLAQAIDRLTRLHRAQQLILEVNKDNAEPVHISYHLGNQIRTVKQEEVIYLHSDGKYTRLVAENGEGILDTSLKQLEDQHPWLLRIHRQTLVNKARIRSLKTLSNGKHQLFLDGWEEGLDVSRRLLTSVKAEMSA